MACSFSKGTGRPNHRKGAWTEEEDNLLRKCVEEYGVGKWWLVPKISGLNRCRNSCRFRWFNYLCPDIKRGKFNDEEDDLIIRLHELLGNRWSLIAGRLPGRTANDVKTYWNSRLSKKLDTCQRKSKTSSAVVEVIRPKPITLAANWTWSEDQTIVEQELHDATAATAGSTANHVEPDEFTSLGCEGREDITLDHGFLMEQENNLSKEFEMLRNVEEYLLYTEDVEWDQLSRDINQWD